MQPEEKTDVNSKMPRVGGETDGTDQRSNKTLDGERNNDGIYSETFIPKRNDKIICAKFSVRGEIDINTWLTLFDYVCDKEIHDDDWKLKNIINYLEGEALCFYVKHCLAILKWIDIKQTLIDFFSKSEKNSFEEFISVKLKISDTIEDYYRTKVLKGKHLKLSDEIILESLTAGLPNRMQEIIAIKDIATTTEWIKTAVKIKRIQDSTEEKRERQSKNPEQHMTWTPRVPENREYRPWRPRTPYQVPWRGFQNQMGPNMPWRPRIQNQQWRSAAPPYNPQEQWRTRSPPYNPQEQWRTISPPYNPQGLFNYYNPVTQCHYSMSQQPDVNTPSQENVQDSNQ